MIGPFDIFDMAVEGVLGRRAGRAAGFALLLVLTGVGWRIGATEWLWDEFVSFKTQQHIDLIQQVLDAADVPTTTTTAVP